MVSVMYLFLEVWNATGLKGNFGDLQEALTKDLFHQAVEVVLGGIIVRQLVVSSEGAPVMHDGYAGIRIVRRADNSLVRMRVELRDG